VNHVLAGITHKDLTETLVDSDLAAIYSGRQIAVGQRLQEFL
jgi:hypothetical protein